MSINYDLAKTEHRKLKGALTRAINSKDPQKVLDACAHAFERFDVWGAYPDDWSRWERAEHDARFAQQRATW